MNVEIDRTLPLAPGPRKQVIAEARVETRPDAENANERWSVALSLRTEDASATRRFSGKTCREVAEATALIVALAVDARAGEPKLPEEPEPSEPAARAPTSAVVDAPAASRVTEPRPLTVEIEAFAMGLLDTTSLPSVTVGPSLGIGVRAGPLVGFTLASTRTRSSFAGAGAGENQFLDRFSAIDPRYGVEATARQVDTGGLARPSPRPARAAAVAPRALRSGRSDFDWHARIPCAKCRA